MWMRDLVTSFVVLMPESAGCGLPGRPVACIFRKESFEFTAAFSCQVASICVITAVLIWHFHFSFDHRGLFRV